jgi:hypothetical protein
VKLLPFSHEYLRLKEPLPFGVYDATGRLLLNTGQAITQSEQLEQLLSQPVFCDEADSVEWRRKLNATVDGLMRQNVTMKTIAQARPDLAPNQAVARAEPTLPQAWEAMASMLDGALREPRADNDWVARVLNVQERARKLFLRKPDGSLYHLMFHAAHHVEKYSAHHALLTLLITELTAARLSVPSAALNALGRAALTMNVGMTRLQDQLASSDLEPSPRMREDIRTHPALGARLLHEGGVLDALWLHLVRHHHHATGVPMLEGEFQSVAVPLVQLLRRVDVFTAKLSRRRTRVAMSPMQAAREACLDAKGQPDELGSALLKTVGLYPPGSFVEMANGELGIVLARGERANQPWVATLVTTSGTPVGEPALRDTQEPRYTVKQVVNAARVRVLPPHERLLQLRS